VYIIRMEKQMVTSQSKQNASGQTPDETFVVLFLQKVDAIKVRLSAVTATEDVTPQQYNILRILKGANPQGLPTLEIGNRMLEHSPGITRLIDRLERKNLVARIRSTEDRRLVTCKITKQGEQVLENLSKPIHAFHKEVTQQLSESERNIVIELISKICI